MMLFCDSFSTHGGAGEGTLFCGTDYESLSILGSMA
jgi:hypothetical protein